MKKDNFYFNDAFNGLCRKIPALENVFTLECHNMRPSKKVYITHERIVDLNEEALWGGFGYFNYHRNDVWRDYDGDIWVDHMEDIFKDY